MTAWVGRRAPSLLDPPRQSTRASIARLGTATAALVTLLSLVLLWPAGLGGKVSYITTHGSSMEPFLHQGDLAVVRPAGDYRVGDVVAYRSAVLDTIVLHRIVAVDGGAFVFKGDNNNWLDGERPTSSQLIGRLWLRVPHGGWLLVWWKQFVAVVLVSLAAFGGRKCAGRRRPGQQGVELKMGRADAVRARRWRTVAVVFAAVGAVAVAVAAVGLSRPEAMITRRKAPYTHRASFAYTAAADPAVYEGGRVQTGDSVFLKLVDVIDVQVASDFVAAGAHDVAGTIGLHAEVRDDAGWQQRLELAPPVAFRGTHAETSGRLDLRTLSERVTRARMLTGESNRVTTVDVVADVAVTGALGNQSIDVGAAPRLSFRLDSLRLTPAAEDAFEPSVAGAVQVAQHTSRRVEVAGVGLPVSSARRFGIVVSLIGGCGALVAAMAMRRHLRNEPDRIAVRYGGRVVPVRAVDADNGRTILEVDAMRDLVRLADQHGTLLLHERDADGDTYRFDIDGLTYRYRTLLSHVDA